ncbi:MAG: cytochrome c biogenesis protein CcdA [Ruminococcaceae bacterium]|nr:cytochrome c biogenesis protein CcdA [Oscillospiraceae bacterium]
MQYLVTFLEGIISFISPCMLPMLPLYISYFAADNNEKTPKSKVFLRALAFVLGFSIVFCLLGLFAGTLGEFLRKYQIVINIICGCIVVLFGFSYLEVIPLPFLKGITKAHRASSIASAFVFGIIYSVSLTPCIGAFLGSALMLASTSGSSQQGVLLLLTYSLGMGIPFLLSSILIERLTTTFQAIKKHYNVINKVCGVFLIVMGILMASGLFNRFLGLFS